MASVITINQSGVVSNPTSLPITTVSGTYGILASDQYLRCSGAVNYTITLPTAVGRTGQVYIIKSVANTGVVLTLATTGGQTIDGATTQALSRFQAMQVISNGTNWDLI